MEEKWFTAARVVSDGRAMTVDLSDAGLNTQIKKPHMTLFFQRAFSPAEVEQVQFFIDSYISTTLRSSTVGFTLEPWGQRSDLIQGDLKQLCEAVRLYFMGKMFTEEQRPPHVAIRA